jgi:hypothetical protein
MRHHAFQGPRRPYEPPHRTEERRTFDTLDARRPVTGEVAGPRAIVCGWCSVVVMEGYGPPSHGMCPDCISFHHPANVALQALAAVASGPVLLLVLTAVTQ